MVFIGGQKSSLGKLNEWAKSRTGSSEMVELGAMLTMN